MTKSTVSLALSIIAAAATAYSPEVQAYIGGHPQLAALVLGVYSIFVHYLPNPVIPGTTVEAPKA